MRSRRYIAETITDADYADDIALLINPTAQAQSLLHSQEQTAADIGLTFHSSNISSTESDVNIRLVKAWAAVD